MATPRYLKIHPAIGVARLGNHPTDFFIGPEKPFEVPEPAGGFTAIDPADGANKIKRQAARFRLYAYDENDQLIGEITKSDALIRWEVSLGNKKAAWEDFTEPTRSNRLRNSDVNDRASLEITPTARNISADTGDTVAFDDGSFFSYNPATGQSVTRDNIYLGELQIDNEGHLLVLGGRGLSESPSNFWRNQNDTELQYANNPGWYDDIADGPVNATVVMNGQQDPIPVTGAWVISAPPNYAPGVQAIINGYDMLRDRAIREGNASLPDKATYSTDVYRLLKAAFETRNVYFRRDGRNQPHHNYHLMLNPTPDMPVAMRQFILNYLRVPRELRNADRPGTAHGNMPKLRDDKDRYSRNGMDDQGLTLTNTQYLLLEQWAQGNMDNDVAAGQVPEPPADITPAGLDRAALENCIGGAFFPGIDLSWFLRDPTAIEMMGQDYVRIKQSQELFGRTLSAGDLTKHMALPWQADFLKCTRYGEDLPGWWPSARPNGYLDDSDIFHPWDENIRTHKDMVDKWAELGFIVKSAQDLVT